MKYFRTSFVVLFIFLSLFFLPKNTVFAALTNLSDVTNLIGKISVWFYNIAIAISVIIMVWGGLEFMTSGGESDKVKKGRDRILWGAVGLAIVILAKSITTLVENLVK